MLNFVFNSILDKENKVLQKTQGIVLNSINYNDKYILVQIFTEALGRATYMVPKSNAKASKFPRSLFFPLTILEINVEHRETRDIHRIKEAYNIFPIYSISGNLTKTSIAFFLSEFLTKVLRDMNDNKVMFQYLLHSIEILELSEKGMANYHLVFAFGLSKFFGFQPNLDDYKTGDIFDMLNGTFVDKQPLHKHFLSRNDSLILSKLARISYENMHRFKFSRQERTNIINRIVEYYRIHLHDFPPIKSLDVLKELFE